MVVRGNPVETAVVVPVFEASNESPDVAGVGVALLVRLKLGAVATVDVDVVVVIVLPRPNTVPVAIGFGVPKVKPVDPYNHVICQYQHQFGQNLKIFVFIANSC